METISRTGTAMPASRRWGVTALSPIRASGQEVSRSQMEQMGRSAPLPVLQAYQLSIAAPATANSFGAAAANRGKLEVLSSAMRVCGSTWSAKWSASRSRAPC